MQENPDVSQLLLAAQLAADRAAAYLRRQEGRMRPDSWQAKDKADFVTEVDRESERMIAETLTQQVPGSVVMGEELSPGQTLVSSPATQSPQSTVTRYPLPVTWIVDPLDGTTNFLHRFPIYAVSIAAVVNGELTAAVVHHVTPDIRYTATAGGGAFAGSERIAVSTVTDPGHALIGTGVPFKDMGQWPAYDPQLKAVTAATAGIRRPGSASLDLAWVASGRFDGFWELKLAPWDLAAGALLIREAGGIVTDLEGKPDVLRHTGLVVGNPTIHSWLLRTVSAAK